MAGTIFSHDPVVVPRVETKFRKIITPIPVPESIAVLQRMYAHEARAMHGQLPILWDRAEDFQVYDRWGNKWIDFTSTIFVANSGHGNKKIREKLTEVLDKPLLHTYTYANIERIEYLEYLIQHTPVQFQKAFLLSSGTEATETALKLMRMHGKRIGKARGGIICFKGAFHGRTMGASLMSGTHDSKGWMGLDDPNIHYLEFPLPWKDQKLNPKERFDVSINKLLFEKQLRPDQDLCGFMIETFQGWSALFYPKDYIKQLHNFARAHNLLIAFDEMQAGFGRTGKLFGYMHYEVEPDLLCCGKGASSSLPLAVVLGSQEIMDLPEVGDMSSTHSGNPLCCAAGHANFKSIIDDSLVERSEDLGKLMGDKLHKLKEKYSNVLSYVSVKGLLASIIFVDKSGTSLSDLCDEICVKAMQKGLLVVHTGRESIKLAPPLTISRDALMEGLQVLDLSIEEALDSIQ